MKKSILIFAFLLPALSFGVYLDDYVTGVNTVRVYTFSDGTNVTYSQMAASSLDSVYVVYASRPFGFVMTRTSAISSPTLPSSTNDFGNSSLNYQVRAKTTYDSVQRYYSPRSFSRVDSLFNFAFSLASQGYDGPGLDLKLSGTLSYYNFDYKTAVANILSSTNSVYRRLVLSHLSTISSNVASIDSSVLSISNLVGAISSSVQPDPFQVDFVSAVRTLQSTSSLGSIDYDGIIFEYNDLPTSEARSLFARGFSRLFDSQKSAQGLLNGLRASPSDLSEIGSRFNKGVSDILNGGGSGGGGIAGDIKRLATNDWAKGVRDQLRDNRDSTTNLLAHMFDDAPNSAGRAIRQTADNTAATAARASDIASRLNGVLHVQVDNPNNIGVVLDGPVTIDTTQFNGVSVPLAGLKDKIDTWYNDWYSFWDISTPAYSWSSFYNQFRDFKDQNHSDLSAITNSLRGVFSVTGDVSRIYDYLSGPQSNLLEVIASSITNNWDDYYFKRFRRANEFSDEDDEPFTLEGASEAVFGRGFDEGEYSRLNWFSRVELLLFQLSAVSSGTNALESVDIEDDLNYTVDSFNQHGQDFVNASRRVVGLFQLIDGFAASMRSAFGGYSDPVTSGIVLLPAGSWIFDNALVLEVPVTIQNALRLVFQCIWYLSAFVVAWRVVVATWSRVVSFVRWLWSVFDI